MQTNERYLLFQKNQIINLKDRSMDASYDRFQHLHAVYEYCRPVFVEHLSGLEENASPEDNN